MGVSMLYASGLRADEPQAGSNNSSSSQPSRRGRAVAAGPPPAGHESPYMCKCTCMCPGAAAPRRGAGKTDDISVSIHIQRPRDMWGFAQARIATSARTRAKPSHPHCFPRLARCSMHARTYPALPPLRAAAPPHCAARRRAPSRRACAQHTPTPTPGATRTRTRTPSPLPRRAPMWRWRRRAAPGLRVPACPYGPAQSGVGAHCGGTTRQASRHALRAAGRLRVRTVRASRWGRGRRAVAARAGRARSGRRRVRMRSRFAARQLGWDRAGYGSLRRASATLTRPARGRGDGRVRALFALCSLRSSVGYYITAQFFFFLDFLGLSN